MKKNKKVLVGISGGVDSSVSALLLKKEGYQVEGVFVKVWQPDFVECNWREEMRDAMRVCAQLEIPFHFLDLENEYKTEVVDYMIDEYKKGRTPNPDVMCNKYIKFGHLFDFAEKNNFDYIATGHYAQNIDNRLYRGVDANKDQSYFLWTLTEDKLKRILFPVGHLNKPEVRKIAEKNNLATFAKKDSQGICFMGPVDMKEFLKRYLEVTPGKVLNDEGQEIGTHEGALLYTLGERHGFDIDSNEKTPNEHALYVVAKDVDKNTITVSEDSKIISGISQIEIADYTLNVTRDSLSQNGIDILFQTRYRQKPQSGILSIRNEKLSLKTSCFAEAPVVGQSAVFYINNECIGGGIIDGVL